MSELANAIVAAHDAQLKATLLALKDAPPELQEAIEKSMAKDLEWKERGMSELAIGYFGTAIGAAEANGNTKEQVLEYIEDMWETMEALDIFRMLREWRDTGV